jgi:hypothetical protein
MDPSRPGFKSVCSDSTEQISPNDADRVDRGRGKGKDNKDLQATAGGERYEWGMKCFGRSR